MRPPESWQRAPFTVAIAIVTGAAWLLVSMLGLSDEASRWGGFIPARVSHAQGVAALLAALLTPLSATLIHAGIVHLAFNLIVHLWCGRSVEAILGSPALLFLYVVGAFAAAAAQYAAGPDTADPMIGASGAISAVIGAYALLFGRNRVRLGNAALATLINALWVAAAWIGLQLLIGYALGTMGTRLAVAAHIGGFLAGLALAKPLLLWKWRKA